MTYTSIVALLKTALLLLTLAQGPNVPQALKTQATTVANQAIAAATQALAATPSTVTTTSTGSYSSPTAIAIPPSNTVPANTTAAPPAILNTASVTPAPISASPANSAALVPVEISAVGQSQTVFATFQSHNQKVVSNSAGMFMTYLVSDGGDMAPSTWRLVQSTDGGVTFHTIYEDAMHGTRAPALETDGWFLFLTYPDWLTGDSYVLILNPHDGTTHLEKLAGATTYGKFASAYDAANNLIYYSPIQGSHFYTFNTKTYATTDQVMFTPGPHAAVQYPNLAVGSDGLLYMGWTNIANGKQTYYSDHLIVASNKGSAWSSSGKTVTLPIVSDDTGPAALLTPTSDVGDAWMDSMLPFNNKVHVLYNNATSYLLRYTRFAMGPNYGIDKTAVNLKGETIQLGGLGAFLTADSKTGNLFAAGPISGKNGIGVLVSRDNGDTWHDFAQSTNNSIKTIYALGGARDVTSDGYLIGSFTDQGDGNKVYFIKVKAR